ncbi:MAG TPA: hypothetical protein PKX00_03760, partial [Opitutaceae bacterium]|nr:hypothetical protein [Opitutaceae bacterium]
GNRVSMIFQQPQSALNPVFKVGDQLSESLRVCRLLAGFPEDRCQPEFVVPSAITFAGGRLAIVCNVQSHHRKLRRVLSLNRAKRGPTCSGCGV